MSGFNAINQFGTLTVNGKKLTFEDFDKNKDGEVSVQEYNSLLKEVKLDSVDLSNVDSNGDKAISKDEFSIWEQKTLMQDAVNALATKISSDFAGKSQYLEELTNQLKTLINDYALTFIGDISTLAEEFKKELPEKYEQIKQNVLANDPSTISAEVIFEFSQTLAVQYANQDVPASFLTRIISELNKESTRFLQNYAGANLRYDLQTHLEEFLNTSEANSMEGAIALLQENINALGVKDIDAIKEQVKTLLQTAIEKGVTLNLCGSNILTEAAIITTLKRFSTAEELLSALNMALSGLNTKPRLEAILAEEQEKEAAAAEQAFLDVESSEYQINTAIIDYTKLDPRYFNDGDIYHKSKNTAKQDAYNEGFKLLTDDGLKSQVKGQIEAMLQAKGIPFERIANIFENIYNKSAEETLRQDGMITGRHKTWFRKAIGQIDVKTMYDTFLTKFNANISKAIDKMNASIKDFDTIDLDYNALDANGVAENGEDFSALYASGNKVTVKKKGADYYVGIANRLIENMKQQMLIKAQNMCIANGVEFDKSIFETIFNNAKIKAINSAVTGTAGKGASAGGVTGASVGAAAGITGGVAALTASTVTGTTTTMLGVAVGASTVPVVGWVAAGVLAVSAALIAIFATGKASTSTLDTQTLVDTFTESFVEDYTKWVNEGGSIAPEVETSVETETNTESDTNSEDDPNKKEQEEI